LAGKSTFSLWDIRLENKAAEWNNRPTRILGQPITDEKMSEERREGEGREVEEIICKGKVEDRMDRKQKRRFGQQMSGVLFSQ